MRRKRRRIGWWDEYEDVKNEWMNRRPLPADPKSIERMDRG